MLRMTKLTDYGTLVLAQLAASRGALSTAGQVARATRLAPTTVSKLLKALVRAGLVTSERGAQGGYALARPAEQISAGEILDALEGPVAITECSSGAGSCDLEAFCRVGHAWQLINRSIRVALRDISLADLQTLNTPLALTDLKRQTAPAATAR